VEVDWQEEAFHERVEGWNIAAMTEEDVESAERLLMALANEMTQLEAECPADKVEQLAARFEEPLGRILEDTAKRVRICDKLKRWWDSNSQKRRKVVGRQIWNETNL